MSEHELVVARVWFWWRVVLSVAALTVLVLVAACALLVAGALD